MIAKESTLEYRTQKDIERIKNNPDPEWVENPKWKEDRIVKYKNQLETSVKEYNNDIAREMGLYLNRENVRGDINIVVLKKHIVELYVDLIDTSKALLITYKELKSSTETINLLEETIKENINALEKFQQIAAVPMVEVPKPIKHEKLEIDDMEKNLIETYEKTMGKKALDRGKYTKEYLEWKKDYL